MAKSVAEQYDLYSDLARGDSEEETVGETREHNDELRKVKANLLREKSKVAETLGTHCRCELKTSSKEPRTGKNGVRTIQNCHFGALFILAKLEIPFKKDLLIMTRNSRERMNDTACP